MAKGLIFDVDGTLLNTGPAMIKSYEHTCKMFDIEETDYTAILPYASLNSTRIFKDKHNISNNLFDEIHNTFYTYFRLNDYKFSNLYPGIRELLDNLYSQKTKMALATARHPGYIDDILNQFDLHKYFIYIRLNEECAVNLDKSIFIKECAQKMGIAVADCLMTGDSVHDIRASKIAGSRSVWAKYGFGIEKEVLKYSPDHIAESSGLLWPIIYGELT